MDNKLMWVGLFVLGAALTWGVYVPTVHRAAQELKSNLRAFLLVGVAYFLVAVLIPAVFIFGTGDPTAKGQPNFDTHAVLWGLAAGTFGAAGALCVIFAANTAGKGGAMYVAPLVFAGAPIVNTIVTLTIFDKVNKLPDWRFFLGLGLAACGASMVMLFKPKPDETHGHAPRPAVVEVAER